jgi:alpha-galactosidase
MADGSRAIALFNESDSAQRIATTAQEAGLPAADAYNVRDLWQHKDYNTAGTIAATVPAHGTVLVRVSTDSEWAAYPPAAELGLEGTPVTEAGRTTKLTTTVTNLGRTPAQNVSANITAPSG